MEEDETEAGNALQGIRQRFARMDAIYIADGHHRCASAVKVGLMRRQAHPDYTGEEEFNYFLSVLFPDEELHILDYNRIVFDLNGYTKEGFLEKISEGFQVEEAPEAPYRPKRKGQYGMYLDGAWYRLTARPHILSEDAVDGLDVSLLQDHLLGPVLGILDPKTDKRIDFVGGIRGLEELQRRVDNGEMKAAFALYPVSMQQLINIADTGNIMPPKTTWFEPKLRSGVVIHSFEE